MTDRERVIEAVKARAVATGKRVFGFSSQKASCAVLSKKGVGSLVPETWDRICVEGDADWIALPEPPPEELEDADDD